MAFVSPVFLYGLFALAIPVLIHLIQFRRYKKVWFTNVKFLAEIQQERRKRSQLSQWLLLAVRLLTVASLVIAFAQPYIPSPLQAHTQGKQQVVSIYVDNSFSMDAVGSEGRLIETAKEKAREIVESYKPSDRFHLLTNDFEGVHQNLVSREDFLKLLDEVSVSPASRQISQVIARQQDLFAASLAPAGNIFLISDFQEATADFMQINADSSLSLFIVPLEANQTGNLFIDTLFFESTVQQPDQVSHLHVSIRNTGFNRLEKIPVKLVINNRQKSLASVSVEPQSETELVLSFVNERDGIQSGYVEIPDYPIVFDDRCYFSYPLVTTIPVLSINQANESPYLSALYGNDSAFHFVNSLVTRLNYSTFNLYSLIILNEVGRASSGLAQELIKYAEKGGSLLIILSGGLDRDEGNRLFQALSLPGIGEVDTTRLRVTGVEVRSALYKNVFDPAPSGEITLPENADLPVVHLHYPLNLRTDTRLEPLLLLQNGDILLGKIPFGKGAVYVLTSPLDMRYSSLPGHILFVPTLYKMALLSQPAGSLYHYTVANSPIDVPVDTIREEIIFRIVNDHSGYEFIPEMRFFDGRMRLYPHDQVREAGLYTLYLEDQPVSGLAFNYPRTESGYSYLEPDAIKEILLRKKIPSVYILQGDRKSLRKEIQEAEHGRPLWKVFILLSLFFLALEIALIRLFPKQ